MQILNNSEKCTQGIQIQMEVPQINPQMMCPAIKVTKYRSQSVPHTKNQVISGECRRRRQRLLSERWSRGAGQVKRFRVTTFEGALVSAIPPAMHYRLGGGEIDLGRDS